MGDLIWRDILLDMLDSFRDKKNGNPVIINLETVISVVEAVSAINAVPRDEYDALLKRFRHLLQSDFIRSFDEYDRRTGTYKRDIVEADHLARVVRCEQCIHWNSHRCTPLGSHFCEVFNEYRRPRFYCAYGMGKDELDEQS